MKSSSYLLCFLMVFLFADAKADHISGGYFQYTCLGNNQYKIDLIIINDCNGVAPYSTAEFVVRSVSNNYSNNYVMPLISTELIEYCGLVTNCEGGLNKGYKKALYSYTVTFPYQSTDWEIFTLVDARNTSYIQDVKMYLSAGINNASGNCFSSTSFTDEFVLFTCTNSTTLYDVEFTNPSNLNVTTSLMCPQGDAGGWLGYPGIDVTYEQGLSCSNPISAPGGFNYNPVTQQVEITPTLIGVSGFGLRLNYTDAFGNYAGYVMREYQIYSSNNCTNEPPEVSTPNGSTILNLNPYIEGCYTVTFSDVNELTLSSVTGPSGMTYSVDFLGIIDDRYTYAVNICYKHTTDQCTDVIFPIDIVFDDPGCLYDAIVKKKYYIKVNKQEYCPLNLFFTNRNTLSGIAMPVFGKSEERIWVGDDMPAIAPFEPPGPVIISDNTTLIAGIEIVLPSCQSGGSDCITLSGNVTLLIQPNSCSAECDGTPIEIFVHEVFECGNEHLTADASGQGPFTYAWNILGTDYVTSDNTFNVHNIVKEQNSGQIPYTCTVYDAVGGFGVFEGEILGTQRFYDPIINNKFYVEYPDGSPIGPSNWYYGSNLGVYWDTPAYWMDVVNTEPPWYGATDMWLTVWDRWGHPINDLRVSLEGGEDWSINNGQIYWNGKYNNGIWADCYESSDAEIYNYTLKSRNCYDDQDIHQLVSNIDEQSALVLFSCTDDDPWNPVETRSTSAQGDGNEGQLNVIASRIPAFDISENIGIMISPNPTTKEFEFLGNFVKLNDVKIIDEFGKVVLFKSTVEKGSKIDVSLLSSGLYTVITSSEDSLFQIKLIIL